MHRTSQAPAANVGLATTSQHSRKLWTSIVIAACALIIAFAGPSTAQTFRGTILGTVTDPNGAVVPQATVTARNIATGIERTTQSDEFGNYTIAELQTGTYEVKVEKSGFQSSTVTGAVVEVAAERRVDVTLAVAGSEATVIVAPAAQVETTTNTLGGTINTKAVADLPVNGRDFTKFLVMVPGSTGDPAGGNDSPDPLVCLALTVIADGQTISFSTVRT